ncbi:MAG: alpha/beta hydrolase [Halioglobus sp.]
MKKSYGAPGVVAVFATLLISIIGAQGQALAGEKVWTLQERTLPVPAAASDALRDSIASKPQPNVAAAQGVTFQTDEEWVKYIAARNEPAAAAGEALAERLKVTIKEEKIAGVTVYRVTPANIDPANKNRLFVHTHGGAYCVNAGRAGLFEAILVAHRAAIPVLSIDYRMPPEDPFPAAVDDVVTVWKSLLKKRDAKSMALGGTSAGGSLTLASTHKLIDLGIPVPGALFAGTPWADLTKTGDSYFTNEGVDNILVSYEGILEGSAKLYAGDHALTDPLISPVYGDFKGFPPTYLVSGTRDMFLSSTVRVHRKLRTAGAVADLNVYEGFSHGDYLKVIDSPESEQVFAELAAFLLKHLK